MSDPLGDPKGIWDGLWNDPHRLSIADFIADPNPIIALYEREGCREVLRERQLEGPEILSRGIVCSSVHAVKGQLTAFAVSPRWRWSRDSGRPWDD